MVGGKLTSPNTPTIPWPCSLRPTPALGRWEARAADSVPFSTQNGTRFGSVAGSLESTHHSLTTNQYHPGRSRPIVGVR